jgi:uncharacterized protein (UPF0261 family)
LKKVALLAALDTRGGLAKSIKRRLQEKGCEAVIMDTGVLGQPEIPASIPREAVADAGGKKLAELIQAAKQGAHQAGAVKVMTRGAEVLAGEFYNGGKFDGIMAMGGTAGTSIALAAMKALPVGVPKLILTTVMGGQSVGNKDIMVMPLKEDAENLERCLAQAAYAMAGILAAQAQIKLEPLPMIGITALGVTTAGVEKTLRLLQKKGYDPVVFHARSEILEELIEEDRMEGIIDFTSFETLLLGKERLLSAGKKALPQLIVPGGLDMLILPGTRDTLSEEYSNRSTHEHGPMIILVRTNPDELAKAAQDIADRANAALGPVKIVIPKKGFSSVDREGYPFYSPETDQVFTKVLKTRLKPEIQVFEFDSHVNDEEFAEQVVGIFNRIFSQVRKGG